MSTVLDRQSAVSEQWKPKSRLPLLAKATSTAFYDALTAIASEDGVCSSMVLLDDGNLRRTSFQGRLNGPKAGYARLVKSVIADLFNEKEVDLDRLAAFKEAAKKLDGTIIVQEDLTEDLVPTGRRAEIKVEGLSRSATSLETVYRLQNPALV